MIYRDDLERVYALLEDPKRWTKGYFARNEYDEPIDEDYAQADGGDDLNDKEQATHPDAACWCLFGAAYKCGIFDNRGYEAALGESDIPSFNDASERTHAEVLALLKAAIERAPVRP